MLTWLEFCISAADAAADVAADIAAATDEPSKFLFHSWPNNLQAKQPYRQGAGRSMKTSNQHNDPGEQSWAEWATSVRNSISKTGPESEGFKSILASIYVSIRFDYRGCFHVDAAYQIANLPSVPLVGLTVF